MKNTKRMMTMTSHQGRIKLGRTYQILEGSKAVNDYLKVSATEPIFSGVCQVEKATIAGTRSKQTWRAYTEPISILKEFKLATSYFTRNQKRTPYLSAMFPFRANEMAFMNLVVFGTGANKVIPRNFSSIPNPSSTTSTTSTSNSIQSYL
jgi:hypothetical protein